MSSPGTLEQRLERLHPMLVVSGRRIALIGVGAFVILLPVAMASSAEQLFWLTFGLIGALFSPVGWFEQVSKSGSSLLVAFAIGFALSGLLLMAIGSILELIQLEMAASRRRKRRQNSSRPTAASPRSVSTADDAQPPNSPTSDDENSGHPS